MTINESLLSVPSFHFLSIQCFHGIQMDTHITCFREVKISELHPRPDLKHSIPAQVKFFYSNSYGKQLKAMKITQALADGFTVIMLWMNELQQIGYHKIQENLSILAYNKLSSIEK